MKTNIYPNYAAFCARADKTENGVLPEFTEVHPDYETLNETNRGCWNCTGRFEFDIPVIKDIHRTVLAAVKSPGALDMNDWRAGWVVTLAGEKGRKLEAASHAIFAAMQIYHASSPIAVPAGQLFKAGAAAMADIERCAAEEAKLDRK